MLFNSVEFFLFFTTIVVCHFLCPHRYRLWILLTGSYVFYVFWRWEYAFLLLGQTLVSYAGAWGIAHSSTSGKRKILLVVTLSSALALFIAFKYLGFAVASLNALPRLFGSDAILPAIDILLPIGISFYTFQAMGYVIDVYRSRVPVEKHLGRYALYVSFFPQLVAGPIERAERLLPQFVRESRIDFDRLRSGAVLIAWGLFKKMVIADRLAQYVDIVYAAPHAYSGSTLLLATYFFAFQIYCDFSGYSDIAVGAARILGYDLMQNFCRPYFADSIAEFWRRWHISLSTWFRDYLFIPLGGSRTTAAKWVRNVLIVFLLSGLWHGANWTFVVWGALHGALYLFERKISNGRVSSSASKRGWKFVRILITFHLVLFAWVFFRAATIGKAFSILGRIVTHMTEPLYSGPSGVTMALSLAGIGILLVVQAQQASGRSLSAHSVVVRWAVYAGLVFGISIFGVGTRAFIYFQF